MADNYINEINKNIGNYDLIFVMSHPLFLYYLNQINFRYMLAYPSVDSKEVYMTRYKNHGNNENWLKSIRENFESLINVYEKSDVEKIILKTDEYLEDALINLGYKLIKK